MNARTEEEAKKKWCPHTRILCTGDNTSYNRSRLGEKASGALCLASACMMWTWDYVNCTDWGAPTEGYCGLIK